MFTVLFIKGTLTFKKNSEIRMTIQAAVVSVFELTFFLYWEYGPSSALPQFWMRTLNSYSMLIYYDVLILPYVVLNKTVKTEMKGIFHGRSSIAAPIVKFSSDHGKAFQRRSL
ncbi:unnamed protein product [Nippostrongylus brasiliensis]|uniref:Serpentine receptor class gamma n=1 Tax=Nippostrongylus brasiliensis TaxID=27835 RepID=A0A0N4YB43_NIPBR|nr:unnamed protein product [Nippostrongylus brasiliensis]